MFFDFFTFAVFQNKSKNFWRLTENPENIFPRVQEISGIFSGIIYTRVHPQKNLSPATQKTSRNPLKTPNSPTWSQYRAAKGIYSPFLPKNHINYVPEKDALISLLNCTVKSRLKSLFFKNNRFKRYSLSALAPLPLEPENLIRKWGIGARIEPGRGYLFGSHICL